jgi:hypothetical protein
MQYGGFAGYGYSFESMQKKKSPPFGGLGVNRRGDGYLKVTLSKKL